MTVSAARCSRSLVPSDKAVDYESLTDSVAQNRALDIAEPEDLGKTRGDLIDDFHEVLLIAGVWVIRDFEGVHVNAVCGIENFGLGAFQECLAVSVCQLRVHVFALKIEND